MTGLLFCEDKVRTTYIHVLLRCHAERLRNKQQRGGDLARPGVSLREFEPISGKIDQQGTGDEGVERTAAYTQQALGKFFQQDKLALKCGSEGVAQFAQEQWIATSGIEAAERIRKGLT